MTPDPEYAGPPGGIFLQRDGGRQILPHGRLLEVRDADRELGRARVVHRAPVLHGHAQPVLAHRRVLQGFRTNDFTLKDNIKGLNLISQQI